MKPSAATIVLLSGIACVQQPERPLPADAGAFIEQRNQCDHLRGEEPYDEERRRFLEEQMIESCTGSDARLAAMKQKYRDDQAVQSALAGYEPKIESGQ